MLPSITYCGGKSKLAEQIAAMLPEHTHYIEPFAGSLAVLLAKKPSRLEAVNDLDRDLMTFWKVLRERPADLAWACSLTPHSRAEQEYAYGDLSGLEELERARRVWVRLTQGRIGCPRAAGGRAGTARRPAESDDVAKAAVARVLADRSYSAQYGRQQVGAQRRQIGEIEGVTDVTTVPPGREQARAAQDSEVAGNLRG